MKTKLVSAGLMAALLACTGGAILIIQAADTLNLSQSELYSWFTSVYVVGGLLNLLLAIRHKIPFAGAHSITAVAFIGTLGPQFTLPELAGGFIVSGILLVVAGFTGIFSRTLNHIPKPIIDALLAGLLLPYVLNIVPATISLPWAGFFACAGYFIMPRVVKILPPMIWALLCGLLGLCVEFHFPTITAISFQFPQPVFPEFSVTAVFSIAIPLSLLIMSNDLAVSLASLKANGYEPPTNRALAASGFASMLVACFGGHAANAGGMMTALCSSSETGPMESRRWAGIVSSLIVMTFGLFSYKVIPLIQMLPTSFVSIMTGFSLFGLFLSGMRSLFAIKPLRLAALLTFAVALSQIHMMGIAAPVWALLVGVFVTKWLGRKSGKADGDARADPL